MRGAGAILVAKTNCPEFALEPQTANPLFGTTRHPADPRLGPGGSSGGCAAAVAGRLTPLSLGTDYGGSVRFPAHCTGIVGLRPSPGAIPASGQRPAPPPGSPRDRFSLVGPLARDVADLALALGVFGSEAATGPDTGAASSTGRSLRSRWTTGEGTVAVRADLVDAVERAATALDAAGHRVEALAPPGLDSRATDVQRPARHRRLRATSRSSPTGAKASCRRASATCSRVAGARRHGRPGRAPRHGRPTPRRRAPLPRALPDPPVARRGGPGLPGSGAPSSTSTACTTS